MLERTNSGSGDFHRYTAAQIAECIASPKSFSVGVLSLFSPNLCFPCDEVRSALITSGQTGNQVLYPWPQDEGREASERGSVAWDLRVA